MSRATEAAREQFIRRMRERLAQGAIDYADQSFDKPPAALIGEMLEEVEDIACWGSILWTRLQRTRAAFVEDAVRQVIASQQNRYADIDAVVAVLEMRGMTKPAANNAVQYALAIGTIEVRDAESGLLCLPGSE